MLGLLGKAAETPAPPDAPADAQAPERKGKKRKRSAWVAFLHARSKGRTSAVWTRDSLRSLSEEYKNLSPDQKASFQAMADAANLAAARDLGGLKETGEQRRGRRLQRRLEERAADPEGGALSVEVRMSSSAFGLSDELAKLSTEKAAEAKR
jgi:hypothetical protein